MQTITPASLISLPSRVTYLSSFLNLTSTDTDYLLAFAPLISPLLPSILDAVYTKLLTYDITAKAFVPRNTDFKGETVKEVSELKLDSEQILLRKDFLKNYLVRLVSTKDLSPESSFWTYLNNVAIMHTGKPGFKHRQHRPDLRVEYIHMGVLLGYVIDIVISAVMEMDAIDNATKSGVLRALNKVVWIQNDLFAWQYLMDAEKGGYQGKEGEGQEEGKIEGASCPFSGSA